MAKPIPTVTPYLSQSQGGNPNVPKGQTGISYPSNFIGPIPYNYAPAGARLSSAQMYNPSVYIPPGAPTNNFPGAGGQVQGASTSNFSAPQQQGPDFGGQEDQAAQQARIELEQALSEYDRQAAQGQNQIGSLEAEQANTLSGIDTMRGRTSKEASTAITEAEQATETQKAKALSTAQDTQRTNRNILRALGILSSSAAGEMLTKPMTEFGKQAGELGTQLVKRKQQVDQWLMDRNQDFDNQIGQIKNQYAGLINNIRTDLRYNGEQRALAVRAASSALQQKLAGIQQTALQYQQAAKEYNNQILSQIAQIQLYQNPNADVSGILAAMLNPGEQRPQGQTASIYQDEQKKKQQPNTLSGLGL